MHKFEFYREAPEREFGNRNLLEFVINSAEIQKHHNVSGQEKISSSSN